MPRPQIPVVVVGSSDRPTEALSSALRDYGYVPRREASGHAPRIGGEGITVIVPEASADGRFRTRPLLICDTAGRSYVERGSREPARAAARVVELARWVSEGAPDFDRAVGSD